MVQTISQVTGVSAVAASNWLYILIAVVVDVCAFFLLSMEFKKETVREYEEVIETRTERVVETESVNQEDYRIRELSESGMSQRLIAKELGISQSTVCRRLKEIKADE